MEKQHASYSTIARYISDNIYNADKMGLFYKCLPNKTYTLKGENASCNRKESKDRLTILVAANMSGTDKLMPLVIGKSANPRLMFPWSGCPIALQIECQSLDDRSLVDMVGQNS